MSGTASLDRMALEQDQQISEVVRREQSRLRSFIRRRVPDPRDAEDILQDVFYELVEANRLSDADRARHRMAVSRGAKPHHRPLPQEEAGEFQRCCRV